MASARFEGRVGTAGEGTVMDRVREFSDEARDPDTGQVHQLFPIKTRSFRRKRRSRSQKTREALARSRAA